MNKGLVHIYCGEGKGKTTAAAGLCVRCMGQGGSVLFVQFLKGRPTGELDGLRRLGAHVIAPDVSGKFVPQMTADEREEYRRIQAGCFTEACQKAADDGYSLLVLDEALGAIETGILEEDRIADWLRTEKPEGLEVVLTGRYATPSLLELADYISRVEAVRHPYDQGVTARRGIEY